MSKEITVSMARVMLALRPGVMDGWQLRERFGDGISGALSACLRVGLIELFGESYALTALGRERCPSRRAAAQAALKVTAEPRQPRSDAPKKTRPPTSIELAMRLLRNRGRAGATSAEIADKALCEPHHISRLMRSAVKSGEVQTWKVRGGSRGQLINVYALTDSLDALRILPQADGGLRIERADVALVLNNLEAQRMQRVIGGQHA